MGKLTELIQGTSNLISRLNETLYFYIDIKTKIPWVVLLIMYLLYKLLNLYLKDGKLSSAELLKLLGGYLFILIAIMGSYTNFEKIKQTSHPEYTFFMVTAACLGIVILVAMLGAGDFKENANKKKLILGALYTPIVLLVLSNGSILEKRLDSLKAIVPRSNSSFINLPSEYDHLILGGDVSYTNNKNSPMLAVIDTIKEHKAVAECAVVGHMDYRDKLIKPFVFIELKPGVPKSDRLKLEIDDFFRKRARGISAYLYPHWIEFVDTIPKTSGSNPKIKYKVLQKRAKNWSDLFSGNPNSDSL